MLDRKGNREGKLENKYGCSGYDNRFDSMKTFMLAKGPSFKKRKAEDEETKVQKWVHDMGKDINVVDIFSHYAIFYILKNLQKARANLSGCRGS